MADTEIIWDKPNTVTEKWIQFVDDNVLAKLPKDTQVKSISPYGASYWTRTAEIHTIQADGSPLSFFLKVLQHDFGKVIVSGEMVGQKAIHDAVPDLVPTPIASGTYAADPNVHFFLCSFHEMTDDIPDVHMLASKVAELHRKAVSPNGKYGFWLPTTNTCLEYGWTDSWEELFYKIFQHLIDSEGEAQGQDDEMTYLTGATMNKIIPRLLRPLETGGRDIQPRLLHGDLWDGNCSTDIVTDLPIIFDSNCIYAHNEYDLAPWRPPRHKMGKPYVKAYTEYFPRSPPEEDFDDRNLLYCIRFNMQSSALYPGNLRFRRIVMDEMRTLVEKYPLGYEGSEKMKGT